MNTDIKSIPGTESLSALRSKKSPCGTENNILIVFILLFGLALRTMLFRGPGASDDINYLYFSELLFTNQPFDYLHHHGGRLFFLTVIGYPAFLFKSITAGAVANLILLSARDLIVVLYSRRRLGNVAAILTAGILSFNPVSAIYAGEMLPDGLLSLMMFLSAAVAYESFNYKRRIGALLLIASGFFAWAGYSSKDTGILIIPGILALVFIKNFVIDKHSVKNTIFKILLFFGAFLLFVAIEMAIYYLISGDYLYRYHAISTTHNTTGDVVVAESLYDFFRRIYWNFYHVMSWKMASMPVLVLGLLVFGFAVLLKKTRYFFYTGAGFFLAMYLIFGTSSFTRLIPLPVQDRYFEIIIPFLAISFSALVIQLHDYFRSDSRVLLFGVCVLLILAFASVPSVMFRAGSSPRTSVTRNSVTAIQSLSDIKPQPSIFVSRELHTSIRHFLPADEYSQLKIIPENGDFNAGFYVICPLIDKRLNDSLRFNQIVSLPIYFKIEEDSYYFSRFVSVNRLVSAQNDLSFVVKHLSVD